jgi:hypothetical protein
MCHLFPSSTHNIPSNQKLYCLLPPPLTARMLPLRLQLTRHRTVSNSSVWLDHWPGLVQILQPHSNPRGTLRLGPRCGLVPEHPLQVLHRLPQTDLVITSADGKNVAAETPANTPQNSVKLQCLASISMCHLFPSSTHNIPSNQKLYCLLP